MGPRQDSFERIARLIEASRSFFESDAWKPALTCLVALGMLYVVYQRAASLSLSHVVRAYTALVVAYGGLKVANWLSETD